MTEWWDGYHEAGVDSGSDVSTKGVPTLRVEEVPELLEVSVDEVLGGSEIEPGIELMDDGLVTDDTENSDEADHRADQEQDGDAYGGLPLVKGGVGG